MTKNAATKMMVSYNSSGKQHVITVNFLFTLSLFSHISSSAPVKHYLSREDLEHIVAAPLTVDLDSLGFHNLGADSRLFQQQETMEKTKALLPNKTPSTQTTGSTHASGGSFNSVAKSVPDDSSTKKSTTFDPKTVHFLNNVRNLSQDKCWEAILCITKEYLSLKHDFQLQFDKVHGDLAAAVTEKKELKKKLEKQKVKLRDAIANKNASLPVNQAIKGKIEAAAKGFLWGIVKFIQSEKEVDLAMKLLLHYADSIPEDLTNTPENKRAFINTYKSHMKKAIFARRNYVAAEHKKAMVKRFKDKGSIPTIAQLRKCLKREIQTEEDKEVFEFYWEELLPKQVGSLVWSKDTRNYETICNAKRRDITSLNMITSDDEAFTVLVVENSYDRWVKEMERKEDDDETDSNSNKKKHSFNGRFTTTDSGQVEWGGWSEEGRKRFKSYVVANRKAREDPATPVLEQLMLARLKKKHKISCLDHKTQNELERANKRKRKRGEDELLGAAKKEALITISFKDHDLTSDEEDEDNDDDDSVTTPQTCKYLWSFPAKHFPFSLSLSCFISLFSKPWWKSNYLACLLCLSSFVLLVVHGPKKIT